MTLRLFRYEFEKRKGIIVQKGDSWGEIAPLPGFSTETLEEAQEEVLSLAPPQFPSVQFGLSCLPLRPIRVPLCALHTPKPGCTTLKLKVGHLSPEEAIALVQPYVGKYRLRIDCNRKWSLDQARRFTAPFSPEDFDYLEEPVRSLAELQQFARFPIALDETFREHGPISLPNLKAIVVKPTLSGHIPQNLPIVLSSSYETSLGLVQIALRASPNCLPLGLDTEPYELLNPPLRIENGYLVWSPSPTPIRNDLLCAL